MCTNRALVNSLECYMDELVDCFEDFVRNSIIIISVAVAFLAGMIAYVLKIIADRGEPAPTGGISISRREFQGGTDGVQRQNIATDNNMSFATPDGRETSTTAALAADQPCCDERVIRNIGFSCSKVRIRVNMTDCNPRNCPQTGSTARMSIPSLPTDGKTCTTPLDSKTKPKIGKNVDSCCSMCCRNKCEGCP